LTFENPKSVSMKSNFTGILCLFISCVSFGQATTCSNAYNIPLNGTCNDYTISTATGAVGFCTDPMYTGTGHYTFFQFTSNASASCVLLTITTSGGQPAEIMFYTGCTGGGSPQGAQPASHMCFNTGSGIWAPAETFAMGANQTYYLRVWTPGTGTLNVCGRNYDPPNDDCPGATPIGPAPIKDNNACAKPGPGVLASQVCAASLENTVFYEYTVASTGASSINISNIVCNNGDNNSNNAMQIGFFQGNCASLVSINCTTTSGANVSANTNALPAGTNVYVVIDGFAGSNCSYDINANNSVPLAAYMKYFSGWKMSTSNLLKWMTLRESNNSYFEIQRSTDGSYFSSIGRLEGSVESYTDKNYSFEDRNPPARAYYRLMQTDLDGKTKPSKIVMINREEIPQLSFETANPVRDLESVGIKTNFSGKLGVTIANGNGQVFYQANLSCFKGVNHFHGNFSNLPDGFYTVTVQYNDNIYSKKIVKLSSPQVFDSFK